MTYRCDIAPTKTISRLLVVLAAHGWTVDHAQLRVGLGEFTGKGEPRGDGTRPRLVLCAEVESYGLRARHPDGRRVIAAWQRRTEPVAGKWTLELAWRERRPGEHAPKQLTTKTGSPSVTALKAYILTPTTTEEIAA